jgi:pimeloyl-ACP methyl ester carboxylesterase
MTVQQPATGRDPAASRGPTSGPVTVEPIAVDPVTVEQEQPVYFPAGENTLFGIHTHPIKPNGVGIVLVQGGDTVNVSMHRNRLAVRLARRFAADGYHVIRFDYHGLGESTGVIKQLHLHHPFTDDVEGAAAYLRGLGLTSIVLIGACFGSRTALSSAPQIPETSAVLLATPPSAGYDRTEAQSEWMARDASLGDYAKRAASIDKVKAILTDPGRRQLYIKLGTKKLKQVGKTVLNKTGLKRGDGLDWVSPMLLDPLDAMVKRDVPVLFVFGTKDPLANEFRRAMGGRLGEIMRRSKGKVELIDDIEGLVHGFPSVPVQEAFFDVAVDWVNRTVPGDRN